MIFFRVKYKFLVTVFLLQAISTLSVWKNVGGAAFAQECNIIYVTPTGTNGAAGTKASPASLDYAFTLASPTNSQLWLAVGNYTISNHLLMITGVTMEGGFDPANNWQKTNSLQTVIYRDTNNIDPTPNRLVALDCKSINNFSVHDITFIVDDAVGISTSTYGIHVTNSYNYNFSRLTITSGNATRGPDGVAGIDGVNGVNGLAGQPGDEDGGCCTGGGLGGGPSYPGSNTGGNGGDGGARGSGKGCFFTGSNNAPDGSPGQTGLGTGGGAGGAGGQGVCVLFVSIGCDQGPASVGANGTNGADGADGADGANGVVGFSTYFIPGDGQDGAQGEHGGGGGGGGGGGSQGCVNQCVGNYNGAGPGGSGGGEGGQGGFGATGGAGGGGTFGIYIDTNGVNTFLKDCFLTSGLQGAGSLGGTPGGNGGGSSGGAAGVAGCDIGTGGAGGNGGKGGKGGNGGNGAPGVSLPLNENPNGIPIAQSDMKATVEPAIYLKNTGCTYSDIHYTTNATGILQWFFDGGSVPLSASGDSVMTQYISMGRHSITLVVDGVPYMFTDFTGIFSDGTLVLPSVTGADTVCPGNTETYSATFPTAFTVLGYDWKVYNPGSTTPAQTGTSPTFTYAFPTTVGKYMITLKTESPCCGWSKIDTFYVDVVPFLTTDVFVSASAPIICQGEQSTFFALPLNGGGTPGYAWNVNGTGVGGATQSSFSSTTLNDGDAITCVMTSSYPCPINSPVTSLPFIITVNPLPTIVCSSNNDYLGAHTGFDAIVAGGAAPYTYNWTFGDGGVDTASSPTHLYGGTGPYNYSVSVTDSNGCTGTCTNSLTIVVPPYVYAGFTFNATPACGNTNVTFTDTTTGAVTWWEWDFGDGSPTSSLQNPTHNYTIPGTYSVKLVAGNSIYSDTLIKPNIISVRIVPNASISYINDTVCFPFSQHFFDASPGAASWLWDFGDGTPTSTLQNPVHKYDVGTYTVSLTVTSVDACSDAATSTVYILPAPTAAFTQSGTVICSGATVLFTDASTVDVTNWDWDFGDGSSYQGNAPPSHVYATQGVYNVTLSVENTLGCKDDTTILAAVNVNLRPSAAFQNVTVGDILIGSEISLENHSTNYNYWLWDFGNGRIDSTDFNATTIYNAPGVYDITLYAIYGPGCYDSATITVNVNDIEVIYIPAAFTPNGDNVNDVFYVYGNSIINFHMYIFDRWGEVIYESGNIQQGWDGTSKGNKIPDGVYSYRINYSKKSDPTKKLTKIGSLSMLKYEY
jgi:gliding motility-associated-like protein